MKQAPFCPSTIAAVPFQEGSRQQLHVWCDPSAMSMAPLQALCQIRTVLSKCSCARIPAYPPTTDPVGSNAQTSQADASRHTTRRIKRQWCCCLPPDETFLTPVHSPVVQSTRCDQQPTSTLSQAAAHGCTQPKPQEAEQSSAHAVKQAQINSAFCLPDDEYLNETDYRVCDICNKQ